MTSTITEIIGSEYEGEFKLGGIVKGRDNCFYCIPYRADQILKIDPSNDETTLVGEEYNYYETWYNGFADEDFIYGITCYANQFLKYNIKTETSELVGDDLGDDDDHKWISGAVADDGCLYCFPYEHNRILKFDPNDDTTIFVGEEIEDIRMLGDNIKAKNGCLYGIPYCASRVAKFNVATQHITFIGDYYEDGDKWQGGVEGMDDNIYGVPYHHDKQLKIDIATETTSLVVDDNRGYTFDDCVVGEDGDIYAIPENAEKVTKFNTTTQEMLEIGNCYDGNYKWSGGVLQSNGYIYCAL